MDDFLSALKSLLYPLLIFLLTFCSSPDASAGGMGRQYGNWAVFGPSGSGKTTYVRGLLTEYKKRVPHAVIFAPSEEMREMAAHSEFVSTVQQGRVYDPLEVEKLFRRYGWLHFEAPPTTHTKDFVNSILEGAWRLGKIDTERCLCLVVYLEAKHYVKKYQMPPNAERVESEGRKFGFDIIKDFQVWASQGMDSPDPQALASVNRRVVLPNEELKARRRLMLEIPQARDPGTMKKPDKEHGWGGEMDIVDGLTGRKAQIHRRDDGSRVVKVL